MKQDTKKNLVSALKITGVLLLIALLAASILAVVRHFTVIDEEAVFVEKISEFYYGEGVEDKGFENVIGVIDFDKVKDDPSLVAVSSGGKRTKVAELKRAYVPTDGSETLIMVCEGTGAYKGTLELMLAISEDKIVKISSYSDAETPGIGSKVLTEKYFAGFVGRDITVFERFIRPTEDKNEGEIAAVTGATKTSNAVLHAVNCGVLYYKTFYEEVFNYVSGVTDGQ